MIKYVSGDLGLTPEQIRHAIVSPKVKPISIGRWKKQAELRRSRNRTQRYIDEQSESLLLSQAKKVSGDIRDVATFGHGHLFLGTHAALTLMSNPILWSRAFKKGVELAYKMKPHEIEQFSHDFQERPLWAVFNKAGLQNNLHTEGTDSELATQSHLLDLARKLHEKEGHIGKVGKVLVGGIEAGHKGFMAIKILRQDLAEQYYNGLTKEQQGNKKVLEAISQLVNNATGATNVKMTEGLNAVIKEGLFAGGMEMSRWEKIFRNPAKAISTLAQMPFIKDLPPEKRVFAKIWAKRVLTQLAVYGSLTVISKALIHKDDETALESIKKDIGKSEMFKIKLTNTRYIDLTSGMAALSFLFAKIYKAQSEDKSVSDVVGDYGRKKLAPTYQTIAEGITGHDAMGNSVPFRDKKPAHSYNKKLSYGEYLESKLPLPVAEGFQQANDANNIAAGIVSGVISGATGFKSYEKSPQKNNIIPDVKEIDHAIETKQHTKEVKKEHKFTPEERTKKSEMIKANREIINNDPNLTDSQKHAALRMMKSNVKKEILKERK